MLQESPYEALSESLRLTDSVVKFKRFLKYHFLNNIIFNSILFYVTLILVDFTHIVTDRSDSL